MVIVTYFPYHCFTIERCFRSMDLLHSKKREIFGVHYIMRNVLHANIAGLNIEFIGFPDDRSMWHGWDAFLIDEDSQAPDLFFRFRQEPERQTANTYSFSIGPLGFQVNSDQTIFGYFNDRNTNKVQVLTSKDWTETILTSNEPTIQSLHFTFFTDIIFRTCLSDFLGFTAHASVVEYNGYAVMFSARSGVGKSTHAEIWQEQLSASIINGDHAVIRIIDGAPTVFGAPWSGTSPYKKLASAPLKAIVLLEQGDNNEISQLDPQEAFQGFLPHCYLPYWNEASMANTLNSIDTALGKLPVYRLTCLPNRAAAELVRDAVFAD